MGNSSSNSTKIYNGVYNNFLSLSSNECNSTASAEIVKNNFTLECLGKCKDIIIAQIGGNLNTTCTINQQMSQSAVTSLSSQLDQVSQVSNDLFNDFLIYSSSSNKSNVTQTSVSNMVNISSNTCNSDSYAKVNDNVFNIETGSANSIVAMSITSDQNSKCYIDNAVSQESHNTLQASVKQKSTVIGMFAFIFSTLLTLAIIFCITLVIIFAGGAVAKTVSSNKKNKETPQKLNQSPISPVPNSLSPPASENVGYSFNNNI